MTGRRSTLDRDARAVGHWTRVLLAQPRLLLAVKTALAAGLAYWIAPQIPGTAADYPYYAPLGAVIAMYPTIKTSLRQGFQVLLGVVIGIVLASAVFTLQAGPPGVLAVGVLVGIGVVLAGIRWLGAGRDWVLTAGLFVLLLGGADAESYGIGYIVQLGVGVVVGVVVNFVIVPPLNTSPADERLRRVRHALADRADEIAGVFETPWPLEDDDWEARVRELPATLHSVRSSVQYADESRRMNPRWLLRRRDLGREYAELAAFERVSFHLQDIAEVSGVLGSTASPRWSGVTTPTPTCSSRPDVASPTSGRRSTPTATAPPPTPAAGSRSPSRSAASSPPSTPTTAPPPSPPRRTRARMPTPTPTPRRRAPDPRTPTETRRPAPTTARRPTTTRRPATPSSATPTDGGDARRPRAVRLTGHRRRDATRATTGRGGRRECPSALCVDTRGPSTPTRRQIDKRRSVRRPHP
jgi:hypothetical protein